MKKYGVAVKVKQIGCLDKKIQQKETLALLHSLENENVALVPSKCFTNFFEKT